MHSSRSVRMRRPLIASLITLLLFGFSAFAQEDSDPNSPTPAILTESYTTRALVQRAGNFTRRMSIPTSGQIAFAPNTKIAIYVTNIALIEGEGPSAFRIDAEDAKGRHYQFAVIDVQPTKNASIYEVTLKLRDEVGFWEPPTPDGDLLLSLTWRGLASNRARVGLGVIGGTIKDDANSVPMPYAAKVTASKSLRTVRSSALVDDTPTTDYVGYRFAGDRKRFLEQATFGPTVALDQRVRRIGLRTWLAEQFEAPYPSLNKPYPDIALKSTDPNSTTLACGVNDGSATYRICIRDFYSMYPVQKWFYTEALYG